MGAGSMTEVLVGVLVVALWLAATFAGASVRILRESERGVVFRLRRLLAEREKLNDDLQQTIDDQTEPWGIKVTTVEIKDVEIPEDMQRAIARQAEAERERRAKIINAEGEFQAAAKLSEAADVISQNPVTIQLRYLQTLLEIGGEQNSTVVFPLPIDLIGPLLDAVKDRAGGGASPPGELPAAEPGQPNGPPAESKRALTE